MASHSEEGNVGGFGWFDAEVIRFKVQDALKFKVPHMGWNMVEQKKQSLLFENVNPGIGSVSYTHLDVYKRQAYCHFIFTAYYYLYINFANSMFYLYQNFYIYILLFL